MTDPTNPLALRGIEFTEFASPDADFMDRVFKDFGFSKLKRHATKDIVYYMQNDIHFLLNREQQGFSAEFAKAHGPAISAMGWRVDNAEAALAEAVKRGAKAAADSVKDLPYPAIYGIGDSLIYFIDVFGEKGSIYTIDFVIPEGLFPLNVTPILDDIYLMYQGPTRFISFEISED
jgi:4-hydroxyphenylpyruvate dioxygenase